MSEITRIEARVLNASLKAPFSIAGARLDTVRNVAVRLDLAQGVSGWGEIPILPTVTPEDQTSALRAARQAARQWTGRDALRWRPLIEDLARALPGTPTVRAGLEMALFDALARSWGIPLFKFFGGASDRVETDITIPICEPEEAGRLAAEYRTLGFTTLKTKVGADVGRRRGAGRRHPARPPGLPSHPRRQRRLRRGADTGGAAHPSPPGARAGPCWSSRSRGTDWDGQARLTREAGVAVAADESCPLLRGRRAHCPATGSPHVINIKLAKCGVAEALEIIAVARASGLGLMIGGMVETRLAMGFSAHLAAGAGAFQWIDLDTPMLLAEGTRCATDIRPTGPRYRLGHIAAGHGGELAW